MCTYLMVLALQTRPDASKATPPMLGETKSLRTHATEGLGLGEIANLDHAVAA